MSADKRETLLKQWEHITLTPDTQWKSVIGYEGLYEVNDHGDVRSVDRIVIASNGIPRKLKGKVLKPKSRDGVHLYVDLSKENIVERKWVHRLVLEAFVGPMGESTVVRHLDGNALNNQVENLTWGNQSENLLDAVGHGTHFQARKKNCPRGHLLDFPNLVDGIKRTGRRSCKACNRTHSRVYVKPYLADKFQEISDDYYEKIMKEEK